MKLISHDEEGGNWCYEYKDWINQETVEKCARENKYESKGCAYCKNCKYRIIKTIITE